MSFKVPEQFRLKDAGPLSSDLSDGNNGAFLIPMGSSRHDLFIIASDGGGWEHVSVSKKYETPSWEDMCRVKSTFWSDPEDWAVQFHPPQSKYVNNHQHCLHLWRPSDGQKMSFPPEWMVGTKN